MALNSALLYVYLQEGLLGPATKNYEEILEQEVSITAKEAERAIHDAAEGMAQLFDELITVPVVGSDETNEAADPASGDVAGDIESTTDSNSASNTTSTSITDTSASTTPTPAVVSSSKSVGAEADTQVEEPVVTRKRPSLKMTISQSRSAEADTVAALTEESNQQLLALRQEFEQKLLTNVQNMSPEELRLRVIQLNTELVERGKWEGLRLQNSIQKVENELTSAYHMLLEQQEKELVNELNQKLATQESMYQLELATRMNEFSTQSDVKTEAILAEEKKKYELLLEQEKARILEETTKDLQQDLHNQVALLRNEQIQQLVAVQKDVESLKMKLSVYDITANNIEELTKKSTAAHQETAVLIALENALSQPSKPFKNELLAAKQFAKLSEDTKLLAVVLDSIPSQLAETSTPPSWQEIKYRFQIVREELRKEALAPPAMKGFLGSAIGTTLANLSSPPEGNILGDGVEETLARVQYNLDKGLWAKAYAEASSIKGYSQTLAKDWIQLAESRLIVDQTLQVLRADLLVNHASLGVSKY